MSSATCVKILDVCNCGGASHLHLVAHRGPSRQSQPPTQTHRKRPRTQTHGRVFQKPLSCVFGTVFDLVSSLHLNVFHLQTCARASTLFLSETHAAFSETLPMGSDFIFGTHFTKPMLEHMNPHGVGDPLFDLIVQISNIFFFA